ncbi:MAG: hypothetical protein AAFQ17_00195 [Pseudomonadota bacterium]
MAVDLVLQAMALRLAERSAWLIGRSGAWVGDVAGRPSMIGVLSHCP